MKSIKRPVITVLNYKVAWFPERTMPKREGQATVAIQAGLPRIKPGLLTNNQRNNRLIGLYPGASSAAAGAGSTALQTSAPTGGSIDHARERLVALLAGLPNFQGLAPLAVPGCSGLRAPCQLKLTSADGLLRGATRKPVYDSARLTDMAPTRLFVDATTTSGWRDKGFYPVLNEQGGPLDDNLEYSLLYDMIRLGREHPLPVSRWDATGLSTCTRSFPASNSHP